MMRIYLLRTKIILSNPMILKYMQKLGIRSTARPKQRTCKNKEYYKKFENHLSQEFHTGKPNEK